MKTISINGQAYTEEEIIEIGKSEKIKRKIAFLIHGICWGATGLFFILIGIIMAAAQNTGGIGLIATGLPPFIIGLVLFIRSFGVKKIDSYEMGLKVLQKDVQKEKIANSSVERLEFDKEMTLMVKPLFKFYLKSTTKQFQILKLDKISKIYQASELIEFEIRVDNELVVDSNTTTKKQMGKALGLGAIGHVVAGDAGAGMVAGALAADQNQTTQSSQREIHHYLLVIKVDDILNPSYVTELPSVQVAEEIGSTLFLIQNSNNKHQPDDIKELEPKTDSIKEDKFIEIKKYKELLDAGIITQEEFDAKKKEILG